MTCNLSKFLIAVCVIGMLSLSEMPAFGQDNSGMVPGRVVRPRQIPSVNNLPQATNLPPGTNFPPIPLPADAAQSGEIQELRMKNNNERGTRIRRGEYVPKIIEVLDLKDIDVLDVFKLISKKSGLNIIAAQNVRGKITVYLKETDVIEALDHIVEAYGWAYVWDRDTIRVMTANDYVLKYGHQYGQEIATKIRKLYFADPADVVNILNQIKSNQGKVIVDEKTGMIVIKDELAYVIEMEGIIDELDVPMETAVYDLSYANVDDMSSKVSEMLTPFLGSAKTDTRSNKILVSDTPTNLEKIEKMIEAFDVKEEQVLIEAKIVQITLSDDIKFGVHWEGLIQNYHQFDLLGDLDVMQEGSKRGQLSIGTFEKDDYTFLLQALQTIGETNILSNPSIAALNNEEAKILVGSQEPYVTTTTTTPSAGPTTTAETVEFKEVGVKLFVTPTIHNDRFVTMKIKPEVSSVVRNITTGNNNTIPVVETSEAETTVTVHDGITIVIGGLIKDESIESRSNVPVLSEIPILGAAFRNRTDAGKKTEIAIFLKPTIITGDNSPANPYHRPFKTKLKESDPEYSAYLGDLNRYRN